MISKAKVSAAQVPIISAPRQALCIPVQLVYHSSPLWGPILPIRVASKTIAVTGIGAVATTAAGIAVSAPNVNLMVLVALASQSSKLLPLFLVP